DHVDLDALRLPLAHLAEQLAEQVVVEAAGQAAVGRDDDVTDAPDLLALDQVRMLELRVRLRDVAAHLLHRARVRTRGLHPVLRLADLGSRDHLERARHLAGVLHALDLGFDFSAAGHLVLAPLAGIRDRGLRIRKSETRPCRETLLLRIPNPYSRIPDPAGSE